ncbi:hypothetical protein IM792_03360 [Mucilaginibacter sp. JRF]|uniref:hypothetical protein n=1 Tax=Mucilaginibacter sp. JRF TaxID=2780088 RepID=UPI001880FF94|nr:hypothetical protein [Mucilaginibacter sp. JRF]MBE9583475.1 hypothetical protein [Mucilaginibacter sp. JRF]
MKAKFIYPAMLLLLVTLLTNCKKNSPELNDELAGSNNLNVNAVTPNTITTIAGSNNAGYQNGTGANARFNGAWGIQYADGVIYVADKQNHKIRKVTTQGVVTTLDVPKAGASPLFEPEYVYVNKAGVVSILHTWVEEGFSEARIYKPDGTLDIAIANFYAIYGSLAKDPYNDYAWIGMNGRIVKFLANPEHDYIGIDQAIFTSGSLEYPESEQRHTNITALAVGYNRVFYFAYDDHLYSFANGGKLQRIYSNLNLGKITSIILNRDSRTMYIAADGYIKRIDSGKLTIIAGPNGTNSGNDGVGRQADVYARSLAMGKTENEIYFSNGSSIRKIQFK